MRVIFLRDSHTVWVELVSRAYDIFIYFFSLPPLGSCRSVPSRAQTCLAVMLAGKLVVRGTLLAGDKTLELKLLHGIKI